MAMEPSVFFLLVFNKKMSQKQRHQMKSYLEESTKQPNSASVKTVKRDTKSLASVKTVKRDTKAPTEIVETSVFLDVPTKTYTRCF